MGVSDFKIYDSDQVSLLIANIPIVSGFADGEFCKITQDQPDFTTKVGTDGSGTRSKTGNRLTHVSIMLMQSSSGNPLLSALSLLDRLGQNGAGIGALLIRDRQGTSLFAASKAWIVQPPDVSFDREATAREWKIDCFMDERVDGGN